MTANSLGGVYVLNPRQLLFTLVLAAGPAAAQQMPASLERYLLDVVKLTPSAMGDVKAGKAVAKRLPTGNDRDVTVFGIARVSTSAAAYFARARDPRQSVAAGATSFGIFSDPAALADVKDFSVDASEAGDLRKCKPGDCQFKLPGSAMQEYARTVDWKGPRVQAQVDSMVHDHMLRFVTAYRSKGNAAMIRFDDRGSVESSEAFKALLAQSPVLHDYAPELRAYLLSYPALRPAGVTEVIYWSNDRLPRLRPTLSINHLVVYTPASGLPVIARKQIYANHYFEGAFELVSAVDIPGSGATYVICVRRYRFDNLPGGLLNVRGRVRNELTRMMTADLERERSITGR